MYFTPGPPIARENLFGNDLKLAHICAACGCFFEPGDPFVALLNRDYKNQPGLEDLPVLEPTLAFTKPECYPYFNVRYPFVDRYWHWMGQYSMIFKYQGVEPVAAHVNCFKLFRRQCTSPSDLLGLWQVGAWRQPWMGAIPVDLSAENTLPSRQALILVSEACRMRQLLQLPTEIVALIWKNCSGSLPWRLAAASDLADSFTKKAASSASTNLISVPLCRVKAWERGQELKLRSWDAENDDKSLMRIAIDSRGICKVETLPTWPQHGHTNRKSLAYITDYSAGLSSATATFQNGLLRLKLASRYTCGPDIWDIPNPPHPDIVSKQFHVLRMNDGDYPEQRGRFYTVELASARGISFFFGPDYKFYGLCKYTQELSTMNRPMPTPSSPEHDLDRVLQLYLPLAAEDRILAIAARTKLRHWRYMTSLVVWTQLAGEVTIGPWMPTPQPAHLLSRSPPDMMAWDACESEGSSIIGAYSSAPPPDDELPSEQFEASSMPQTSPLEGCPGPVYFSHAPLLAVRRATVFDAAPGFCRSILFEYENGAQRMVGEYRSGELSCTTYEEPKFLRSLVVPQDRRNSQYLYEAPEFQFGGHAYNDAHPEQVVKVDFAGYADSTVHSEHDGWLVHEMKGVLNFFFTADECGLDFVDA